MYDEGNPYVPDQGPAEPSEDPVGLSVHDDDARDQGGEMSSVLRRVAVAGLATVAIGVLAPMGSAAAAPPTQAPANVPQVELPEGPVSGPIVGPDGRGKSASGDDVSIAATCGSTAFTSITGGLGPQSKSSCAVWGSVGALVGYRWSHSTYVNVCTQGSYYANGIKTWRFAGCGQSGGVIVPWGNNLGYPYFRASGVVLTTVAVPWRH